MSNFEIFKNACLETIFESLYNKFNENSSNHCPFIKKHLYSPKTENEFKNALKNIIWIYKDNENIIIETPGSIDYPGTLCEKIMSSFICNNWLLCL